MTTSNIIDLADHRTAAAPDEPVAVALAALSRTAGLATRVRVMIDAGASDVFLDVYVATWIESARGDLDANRDLHLELAKRLGALA